MRRCITAYTNDYSRLHDLLEEIARAPLSEDEEREYEGITLSDSGTVDDALIERMRRKDTVAVMTIRDRGITIFEHGGVFEILLPNAL
ncbi:MAG: NAD/NADP transhydrogenase alpha subunit [Candidatus Carbobacillus sp.]|nr:NAD/NADP transhydrogenase alpha subunit [Candidatus Carbobacillus sp.]